MVTGKRAAYALTSRRAFYSGLHATGIPVSVSAAAGLLHIISISHREQHRVQGLGTGAMSTDSVRGGSCGLSRTEAPGGVRNSPWRGSARFARIRASLKHRGSILEKEEV